MTTGYKRMDELVERAKHFSPKKKKYAFELLNDELRDLGIWPGSYQKIIKDAKEAIDAIEESSEEEFE